MLFSLQFGKHRIGDRDTGVVPVDAGELPPVVQDGTTAGAGTQER